MQSSGMGTIRRGLTLLTVVAGTLALVSLPALAQAPVMGATAPPTTAPGDVMPCPVTLEQATTLAGMPMLPSPMYPAPGGGTYVERTARAPGLEDETTTYTCAFISEATDGRTYGTPDRQLFISFALGDSAAWLWELNGPGIEADPTFVPLVDGDPTTLDAYRQVTSYEADGEALVVPRWSVRDYLHSDQVFADIIVSAAGDTQATHDEVLSMASVIGLQFSGSTAP